MYRNKWCSKYDWHLIFFKAIHYTKTFNERLQLAQSQIDAISDASNELLKSKSISKVFELILALGNFMNKGARGNSPGFKLNSLSKLRDTKSSDGQHTLLHYLVSCIESTLSFRKSYQSSLMITLFLLQYFSFERPISLLLKLNQIIKGRFYL